MREGSCRCGGKHYADRRGLAVGVGDARAGERVVRPRALTRGPLLSVAGRARVRLRQLAGLARRAGWAGRSGPWCWAGAGEKGGGDGLGRAGCWARAEGKEVGRRVGAGLGRVRGIGLGFWVGSSFSISIPFQTQLFEFKLKFEFKPYALKQIKQCTSMNAHTF